MKSKAVIPLVIGVVIGLMAVKFGLNVIKKAKGSTASETVVVAKADIPALQPITADMLTTKQAAKSLLPKGCFSDPKKVVKRVTNSRVHAGLPLLSSMLAPPGTAPGLPVRIKPGFRAVSVKIDEVTGVAFQLKPGDFVDVIAVMKVPKEMLFGDLPETVSRTIIENVEVAAVGRSLESDEETDRGKPAKSATLLVKPEQIPRLHLAQTLGKITLSLRGSLGNEAAKMVYARQSELFEELGFKTRQNKMKERSGKSSPNVAPIQLGGKTDTGWAVTVVNGDSVDSVVYENDSSMKTKTVPKRGSTRGRRSGSSSQSPLTSMTAENLQTLAAQENGNKEATSKDEENKAPNSTE